MRIRHLATDARLKDGVNAIPLNGLILTCWRIAREESTVTLRLHRVINIHLYSDRIEMRTFAREMRFDCGVD
jgi:hypothetical protein